MPSRVGGIFCRVLDNAKPNLPEAKFDPNRRIAWPSLYIMWGLGPATGPLSALARDTVSQKLERSGKRRGWSQKWTWLY